MIGAASEETEAGESATACILFLAAVRAATVPLLQAYKCPGAFHNLF